MVDIIQYWIRDCMEAFELLTYKGACELFMTLKNYRTRQFSISELARVAGLPFGTTWRLVQKFDRAQLVETGLLGKTRTVQYKESPYSKLVGSMIRMSKSYQALSLPALKRILREKERVQEAYLFGSVAIHKEKLESDIDVALLLDKPMDRTSFVSAMNDKYGVKIIPITFYSKDEFDDFLKEKKTVRLK